MIYGVKNWNDKSIRYDQTKRVIEKFLADLKKNKQVDFSLVREQLCRFAAIHAAQCTSCGLKKSANLIIVNERCAVRQLGEHGLSLFRHAIDAEACDLILDSFRVRRLTCDILAVDVAVLRQSAQRVLCKRPSYVHFFDFHFDFLRLQ